MEDNYWHSKWSENDIGFHESEGNKLLARYFRKLGLAQGSRVFVPLCGKTRDIAWLLSQGYRVVGAELSELAVKQLFRELGVEAAVSESSSLMHFAAEGIDVFVGDIFDLTSNMLGSVDAVYDRAALVALPELVRSQYSAHLISITESAPQLLICFEYEQGQMKGPPFSIIDEEVGAHYEDHYYLNLLDKVEVAGGLKGKCVASENVWLLRAK